MYDIFGLIFVLHHSFCSVSFELQHNVCGRRVYAEGTADAVAFIHKMKSQSGSSKSKDGKRLYNMIDVLESGAMF